MTPLALIEAKLGERIGFSHDSLATALEHAVRRRARACGLDDLAAYAERVSHSDELQELVEEIVVPETWFFRDPAAFACLETWAREEWPRMSGGRSLRALSLACGSGEEPYSMAICLGEAGVSDFEVLGVDIRRRALAEGVRAVYRQHSFRGGRHDLRDRFFTADESGFRLHAAIASRVRFAWGNAIDPGLLAKVGPFDVLFCRNLMIYLHPQARRAVTANVTRLLADSGVLFTGHAETESVWNDSVRSLRKPRAFAFCKCEVVAERPRPARPPAPRPRPARPVPLVPALAPRPHVAPTAATLLEQARRAADAAAFEEALTLCRRHLEQAGASAEVYFLVGVLHHARHEDQDAVKAFLRAVYLDPDHHHSLSYLAVLAAKRGDERAAKALRVRAERAARRAEKRNAGADLPAR